MMTATAATEEYLPRPLENWEELRVPDLEYEVERWSTTRSRNVSEIAKHWESRPNLVRFLEDPKLVELGSSLAILRKEMLEQIVAPLMKLRDGRAAIRVDIKLVSKNVAALKKSMSVTQQLVKENAKTNPGLSQVANLIDSFLESVEAIEISITHLARTSVILREPRESPNLQMSREEEELAEDAVGLEAEEPNEGDLRDFLDQLKRSNG